MKRFKRGRVARRLRRRVGRGRNRSRRVRYVKLSRGGMRI